ncbi:MAG: Kelch repeat-containing protein, partial [Gemmatimonadales bacterium]
MRALRGGVPAGLVLACSSLATTDGSWSTAAPIPIRVQEMHAAVLGGRIYIAGGFDSSNAPTAAAFRYDPATNQWEPIGDLPSPRHHAPLAVANDSLYLVGGLVPPGFTPTDQLLVYRADLDQWQARAPLPTPRGASAVGVVGGKVVVVGGLGPNGQHADSTAVYDPAADSWLNRAPILTRRDHLAAAEVNGIVYA